MANSIIPKLDFTSSTPAEGYIASQHVNDNYIIANSLNAEKFNEFERLFDQMATLIGDAATDRIEAATIGDALYEIRSDIGSLDAPELTYYLFAQMFGPGVLPDPEHKEWNDEEADEFAIVNNSDSDGLDLSISGGTGVVGTSKLYSTIVSVGTAKSLSFDDINEETVGTMVGTDPLTDFSGGESHVIAGTTVTLDKTHLKSGAIPIGSGNVRACVAIEDMPSPAIIYSYKEYGSGDNDFDLNLETGEITNFPTTGTFLFYYVHFQYRRDRVVLKYGGTDAEKIDVISGSPANTLEETVIIHNISGELPLYEIIIRPENNKEQWEPSVLDGDDYGTVLPDTQVIDLRVGRKDEEARRGLKNGVVSVTQDQYEFNFRPSMSFLVKAFDAIVDGALVRTLPTVLTIPAAGASERYDYVRIAKNGTVDLVTGIAGDLTMPATDANYAVAGIIDVAASATAISGENIIHLEEVAVDKHSAPNIIFTKDRPLSGFAISGQASYTQSHDSLNHGWFKSAVVNDVSFQIDAGTVLINGIYVEVPEMEAYTSDISGFGSGDYRLIWVGVNKATLKIDYRVQDFVGTQMWDFLETAGGESYLMETGWAKWNNLIPLYVFMACEDSGLKIGLLADRRDFHPVQRPRIKTGIIWKSTLSSDDWTNERVILRHDLGASEYAIFVQPLAYACFDPGDAAPAIEYISNNQCIIHHTNITPIGKILGYRWIAIAQSDQIEWGTIKAGYNESTCDTIPVHVSDKMYSNDEDYPAVLLSNIYHEDWELDHAIVASKATFGLSGEVIGLRAHIFNNDGDTPTPHYVNYAVIPDALLIDRGYYVDAGATYIAESEDLDMTRITMAQVYQPTVDYTKGGKTYIQHNEGATTKDKVTVVGSASQNVNWMILREPIMILKPYSKMDL